MKNTQILSVITFLALALSFSMPLQAAATSCNCVSGIQNVQYPVPQYHYYQNPAQAYINGQNYTPYIYPISLYVQTGVNSAGQTVYGNNTQTYPGMSYIPYGQTTGTPVYGSYTYPQTAYNTYGQQNYGYNNPTYGNTGFTMGGTSSSNSYNGATSGGFIKTSGY